MASSNTLEVILALKDNLTAATTKAAKGIMAFASSVKKHFSSITDAIFSVKNALMGVAVFAVGKFTTGFIKGVADLGDELKDLQDITGISVEKLSELRYISSIAGVDFGTFAKSLKKAGETLAEYTLTGGKATALTTKMGEEFLSAARAGKPIEDMLPIIARGLDNLTAGERIKAIRELFGKGSDDMVLVLRESGDEIERLTKESHELGVTWTELEAKESEGFIKSLERMHKAIEGLTKNIVTALLPTLTEWIDKVSGLVKNNTPDIIHFGSTLLRTIQSVASGIVPLAETIAGSLMTILSPILKLSMLLEESEIQKLKVSIAEMNQDYIRGRVADVGPFRGRDFTPEEMSRMINDQIRMSDKLTEAQRRLAGQSAMLTGRTAGGPGAGGSFMDQIIADLDKKEAGLRAARAGGSAPGAPGAVAGAGKVEPSKPSGWIQGLTEGLDELKRAWTDTFSQMKQSVVSVGNAIVESIVSGLESAMDKTKSWGDALKDMAIGILKSIRHELLEMATKMILIRGIVGGLGGLLGPTATNPYTTTAAGAAGVPMRAQGTPRTDGPVIAGEAGHEAVIPLPDGRSVPVRLSGSQGLTVYNVTIQATDWESFRNRFRQGVGEDRDLIAGVAAQGYQGRPALRRKYA